MHNSDINNYNHATTAAQLVLLLLLLYIWLNSMTVTSVGHHIRRIYAHPVPVQEPVYVHLLRPSPLKTPPTFTLFRLIKSCVCSSCVLSSRRDSPSSICFEIMRSSTVYQSARWTPERAHVDNNCIRCVVYRRVHNTILLSCRHGGRRARTALCNHDHDPQVLPAVTYVFSRCSKLIVVLSCTQLLPA